MQLSKIQYGVWLFSGEMTLLQRLKNLASFWAFRSLLSVKEGNLFSSIKSTFSFFLKIQLRILRGADSDLQWPCMSTTLPK